MFGSSEQVCDLREISDDLNFPYGVENMEQDCDDAGGAYADIRHDAEPLIDCSGSKTSLSSNASFLGKESLNQCNGSVASLSSQRSKQIRSIEDDREENFEEHVGLLENDGSQGSDDAFESDDVVNENSNTPKDTHRVRKTSLDSAEPNPAISVHSASSAKPRPPRRPSQQTEV